MGSEMRIVIEISKILMYFFAIYLAWEGDLIEAMLIFIFIELTNIRKILEGKENE
jgi:hypothetical protein